MPTYRTAPQGDVDLLDQVLQQYHAELADAGVTIGLLHAHARRDEKSGEPLGPALKLHGYPCAAVVKINSHQDRVEGKPDATVKLDADTWNDRPHEEKVAILDHELEHLVLVKDKEGAIEIDDACRPKLKMRLHDMNIGGFEAIVDRHKTAALEAQAYIDLHRQMSQKTFPWG
jgi:hypothetical protein